MLELRITIRGLVPSIGLLLGLVLLPYLLAGSLSVQQAELLVAGIHERGAIQAMLDRAREPDVSSWRGIAVTLQRSWVKRGQSALLRCASDAASWCRRSPSVPRFSSKRVLLEPPRQSTSE